MSLTVGGFVLNWGLAEIDNFYLNFLSDAWFIIAFLTEFDSWWVVLLWVRLRMSILT